MNKEEKVIPKVKMLNKEELEILKKINKYLLPAHMTNFAFFLTRNYWASFDGNFGAWWLNESNNSTKSYCIDGEGKLSLVLSDARNIGIRPVIKYSSIASQMKNIEICDNENLFKIGEYGEYPQQIICDKLLTSFIYKLEKFTKKKFFKKTGRKFTIDSYHGNNVDEKFTPQIFDEYEYQNKKIVRLDKNIIEIKPIKWIILEDYDLCIAEKVIIPNIQYNNKNNNNGNYENTAMWFLNTYFAREIISLGTKIEDIENKENRSIISENKSQIKSTLNTEYQTITLLLDKLKYFNYTKYLEYKKELELIIKESECKDSFEIGNNEINLTLYSNNKISILKKLINLEAKIKLIFDFKLYTENDIIICIDNLVNKVMKMLEMEPNNIFDLNEINKISEIFLNNINAISLSNQVCIANKISLLYLIAIKKYGIQKDIIKNNNYILSLKNYIYILIKDLLVSKQITINNSINLSFNDEISLEYILEIINNIEFTDKQKSLLLSKKLI